MGVVERGETWRRIKGSGRWETDGVKKGEGNEERYNGEREA